MDIAKAEAGERELNAFIDRQAKKRRGADAANKLEEFWAASERRVLKARREENRTAWVLYFSHLAHGCRQRAEEYEAKADALLEDEPKGDAA